jgi:hypothetical protein
MRRIDPTILETISANAGTEAEALLQLSATIKFDLQAYVNGVDLLSCILPDQLPNIPALLTQINQELTNADAVKVIASYGLDYLAFQDNARSGTLTVVTNPLTSTNTIVYV